MAFTLQTYYQIHIIYNMKTLRIKAATFSIAIATLGILGTGCDSLTKTQKGAAIGAGAGGTVGAFIGRNMDRQAAEIKQTVPGATVTREGEGILVKFDSGILFDTNSSDLKPAARTNLQNLATSLQNNPPMI